MVELTCNCVSGIVMWTLMVSAFNALSPKPGRINLCEHEKNSTEPELHRKDSFIWRTTLTVPFLLKYSNKIIIIYYYYKTYLPFSVFLNYNRKSRLSIIKNYL